MVIDWSTGVMKKLDFVVFFTSCITGSVIKREESFWSKFQIARFFLNSVVWNWTISYLLGWN